MTTILEWVRVARLLRMVERGNFVWQIQRCHDGYTAQVASNDIMLGDCDMPPQDTPSAALWLAVSVVKDA